MSMSNHITTNTQLNQRLADFLVDTLDTEAVPVSASWLSMKATQWAWQLVQSGELNETLLDTSDGYRNPTREIDTARVNRLLARTPGVIDKGVQSESGYGGRKTKHWTTRRNDAALSAAQTERSARIAAINASVVVREIWDRFEVIVDNKLPVAVSVTYRRISHFCNGVEVEDEILPKAAALLLAEKAAREIRLMRIAQAGL